jgi:UDP-2-acetamido-2-deoxy-ribo-hexuluronate aminotransferase
MLIRTEYDAGGIRWPSEIKVNHSRFPLSLVVPDEFVAAGEQTPIGPTMSFIDLKTQQRAILPALLERLQRVLSHGQYVMGPEVLELEHRLAEYVGVRHAVTCSSGTDALLMPLMAYGVHPGDAIFTTPFTFVATAEVIQLLGATPVFVDVEARTFNLDPDALAATITGLSRNPKTAHLRPRGIIPVDLFGHPADYDRLNALAAEHGLFVLEDAAQSFGGTYKGKRAGALAEVAATSFFPAKPLGCYGDGGAVFTDDDGLAEVMRSIRIHGQGRDKYENVRIGLNGRLDTLQAAILLVKLEIFAQEVLAREQAARRYHELLKPWVETPDVAPECTSVWAQYSVLSEQRAAIQRRLQEAGIPSAIYYPLPLHLQKAFKHLGCRQGDFPVSEFLAGRIFSLPMHPYLKAEQQEQIAAVVRSALS